MFQDLLIWNMVRGRDSVGAASFDRKGHYHTLKSLASAPKFVNGNEFQEKFVDGPTVQNAICTMGHNRAATSGKVNLLNCHPFHHGSIHLMHNGTLFSDYALVVTERGKRVYFDTDSEHICKAIDTLGVETTWEVLDGAAMLAWFDTSDGSLNFLRNTKRPLHIGILTSGHIIWASEDWMIRCVIKRHGAELVKDKVSCLKPDWHFRITLTDKNKLKINEKKLTPLPPLISITPHIQRKNLSISKKEPSNQVLYPGLWEQKDGS